MAGPQTMIVLKEVGREREEQDQKWGEVQDLPNGTGVDLDFSAYWSKGGLRSQYEGLLELARHQNDGDVINPATFESVLREEFCEAMLEDNPLALRGELKQVAAVAVKWIEHIDRTRRAA